MRFMCDGLESRDSTLSARRVKRDEPLHSRAIKNSASLDSEEPTMLGRDKYRKHDGFKRFNHQMRKLS